MTVVYKLEITFVDDNVRIISTGEGIQLLTPLRHEAVIRHRHTKLVNELNDLIRQYAKANRSTGLAST